MRGTAPGDASPDPGTGHQAVRRGGHAAPPGGRRRTIALLLAASLIVGAVALIGQDLLRGGPDEPDPAARPLSTAEAERLASMRQHNWQDARAGIRATIGDGPGAVQLAGWVDWRHPMVYLARSGPSPGTIAELVQAVPGLVATRPGPTTAPEPTAAAATRPPGRTTGSPPTPDPVSPAPSPSPELVDPIPEPPLPPPVDGWRVRSPGEDGPAGASTAPGTVDALAVLLLTITAEQPDAAGLLAGSEAQWLRQDRTAGHPVDVLLGPAVPPSAPPPAAPGSPGPRSSPVPSGSPVPTGSPGPSPGPASPAPTPADRSLAAMGGAVQYWLDHEGRLHRLEALLAADTPVEVDLDRTDRTAPPVLDLLGGAAVDPRPVTDQQVDTLAQLRARNQAAGGGQVTVVVPDQDGATVRATGWLDWQRSIVYISRARDGAPDGLLWADRSGVATRPGEPDPAGGPPLPAPQDSQWQRFPWEERGDQQGGFDLDLLLNEALSLSHWQPDPAEPIRAHARWLRADRFGDTRMDVYEIPRPIEAEVAPGEARLRYWVARESGVLHRLEIRTRSGGYGQLDLTPGPVPNLG